MSRRLISANNSDVKNMSVAELKSSIRASEGRTILSQNYVGVEPLVEGTIKGFPLRPIVRIIESKDSTKIGKCINLVDNLDISIVELIYYL